MCPSYLATRDEKDSTRGRVPGAAGGDRRRAGQGFADPAVAEALDLCLACKGCASDCPTGVDMATYKAEALHQKHDVPGRTPPAQPPAARPAAEVGRPGRAGGAGSPTG